MPSDKDLSNYDFDCGFQSHFFTWIRYCFTMDLSKIFHVDDPHGNNVGLNTVFKMDCYLSFYNGFANDFSTLVLA